MRRNVLSLIALLVMSACASATSAAQPSHTVRPRPVESPPAPGPHLSGTVSVFGQFVLRGAFTSTPTIDVGGLQTPAPAGTTCAAYARGYAHDPGHPVDAIDLPTAETHATPSLYVAITLANGYRGPGLYSSATHHGFEGAATVAVQTSAGPSYYVFHSLGAPIAFSINADGGGRLTFSGWQDDEKRGGNNTGTLGGTITWTCH